MKIIAASYGRLPTFRQGHRKIMQAKITGWVTISKVADSMLLSESRYRLIDTRSWGSVLPDVLL